MQRHSMSSLDVFVSVCETAWNYFYHDGDTRRSIRAACRDGRQLHDGLSKRLSLELAQIDDVEASEVHATFHGAIQRGAKFGSIEVVLYADASFDRQEQQL